MMIIDFHEKMNKKSDIDKVINKSIDEVSAECMAQACESNTEQITTIVWGMPDKEILIKEDLKYPAFMTDFKAQIYANYFARKELNNMEKKLQKLEEKVRRSRLFANIDMDMLRKVIYNPVKTVYIDKHERLREEYVEAILEEYATDFAMEELFKDKKKNFLKLD